MRERELHEATVLTTLTFSFYWLQGDWFLSALAQYSSTSFQIMTPSNSLFQAEEYILLC